MLKKLKSVGPGILVAAAFIGPGTVTTATLAGGRFGFALLWALLFATIATILLQEMSARLGTVSQQGLGETLSNELSKSLLKWPMLGLLLAALYLGNIAYEGGNLSGAALGVTAISGLPTWFSKHAVLILASISALVLCLGNYKTIEKMLIALVLLMSLSFVFNFFVIKPSPVAMLSGLFKPSLPDGSLMMVIALIGTTVVPYNLFLHAAAAKQRWSGPEQLQEARSDTVISIGLGGLITILVASTAAASIHENALSVNSAADMAVQLEPLFGSFSKSLLGIGLFAAGLSSAITAPLATGFAVSELFGFKGEKKQRVLKMVSVSVVLIGASITLVGIKPIQLILLAQYANGLLLPIVASFLLWGMNRKELLGRYANSSVANFAGGFIVLFTLALGVRAILKAYGAL